MSGERSRAISGRFARFSVTPAGSDHLPNWLRRLSMDLVIMFEGISQNFSRSTHYSGNHGVLASRREARFEGVY